MDNWQTTDAKLHPATRVGTVHLKVSDVGRAAEFYRDVLGMKVLHEDGGLMLGVGAEELVGLRTPAGVQPRPIHSAGLYHLAILLPDRRSLAHLMEHMIRTGYPIGGASDHGVSEAVYLSDPDGNGIEVYRDRPQEEWPRHNGEITMVTEALDIDGLFAELGDHEGPWQGLPDGTRIGHVHLQVGDLNRAEVFYRDVLGMDRMQRYGPSAVFLSAGGYHHHVGLNTWAGVGAPPAPANAIGLDYYTLILPDGDALAAVAARMRAAEVSYDKGPGGLETEDPAGNRLMLISATE